MAFEKSNGRGTAVTYAPLKQCVKGSDVVQMLVGPASLQLGCLPPHNPSVHRCRLYHLIKSDVMIKQEAKLSLG